MTKKPGFSKRSRALFALNKLSDALQGDVLADPATAKIWDINIQRTMRLIDNFPMHWDDLFSAFRNAASGKAVHALVDVKGNKLDAKVTIDAEGGALVETRKAQTFAFLTQFSWRSVQRHDWLRLRSYLQR